MLVNCNVGSGRKCKSSFLAAEENMSYNLGDQFPGDEHGKICH